jgi:membrane protein required for beta-lactamase induction
VATLVVLAVNMALTLADRMIPLDWLSLLLCVVGFALLGGVARTLPHDVDAASRGAA